MIDRGSTWLRLRGLLRKEIIQIQRDPSSILLALVMPGLLLFLFGYGLSLNPTRVPVALVAADNNSTTRALIGRFQLSPYFVPHKTNNMMAAENLMQLGQVDAIIHLRKDFAANLLKQKTASLQIIVNGIDANRARLIQGYCQGILQSYLAIAETRGESTSASGTINMQTQIWFNKGSESRNFLVPGLLVLIMTMIGTLLTALVIAREWERGTMEALLITPIRVEEFLLAKTLPYFALGMLGMGLAVGGGVWVFQVPLRGSFLLLAMLSALFLLASLGFGLAISAITRKQFVAAQISVIAGFLPAFFLSGLLFDLESTPRAIQLISHLIPARYFVRICHTLFMAGNVSPVLWRAALPLSLMALLFFLLVRRNLSKRLE